jgi:DNA mismatch repair protein MutS2
MNKKALKTLEFYKITHMLEELASSEGGKALCRLLEPSADYNTVLHTLTNTDDALTRLYAHGEISFAGTTDLTASMKRLEIGASLSSAELLSISAVLSAAARVKEYGAKKEPDSPADSLNVLFDGLLPVSTLKNEITRCILAEDEISDDASPALREIRRQLKNSDSRIHSELASMVNAQSMKTYLQESVVTMRGDRYCIPVKAEYRSQVPGMIHDQSSTGSTLFIEPMAIVRLNNEIHEWKLKEAHEIEVILASLSAMAAEHMEELNDNVSLLTRLDFIFAKASLAKKYRCTMPEFNQNGYINIKKGRHPLIAQDKVVPIDIYLGKDFNTLIITGPNTGGKTVSLKTVGLLTLMGQAGLCIPAFEGSQLALFDDVFADIGDEQSIEQSLSTFSSHMTNIIRILNNASEHSLVLFDELCAGTDPTEGAALAISILDRLHKRNIRTMATTHYSEIKVYALSEAGVENACCEFSVETLSPTYRLLIGIPGKSNAFAISKKLGLSEDIIENASARISSDSRAFEDLIADLETSRITIEREREEISAYKDEISRLKDRLEQKTGKLDEQREQILREANEKAAQILREAKEYADDAIKTFHKSGLSPQEMEEQRRKLREKKEKAESRLTLKQQPVKEHHYKPSDFTIGTRVRVLSMNLEGTVSTLPNQKGNLFVQMGILRSQVNISDLEIIDEAASASSSRKSSGAGKIKMNKTVSISPEINLIGMTVDEALIALDKYLDDAYLSRIPQVRIVHGKGTGALRNAVHSHLKRSNYVKGFRLGAYGEGEAGVTIVEFK